MIIRRLFLSALGVVYAIAFASLWVQIDGLIGSAGILPARDFLASAAPQLGPQPWLRVPTIAWFSGASDPALHLLCGSGMAASLLLLLGVAPAVSAAVAWLLYLSLYSISGDFLSFQWDILLLEAGFLAIFYAPPLAVSPRSPSWRVPPSRPVLWLLRLLIAKLMFLSGVVKLSGGDPTWRDLTALTYHYETTCLPTWTGWYMHQLPVWFHKLSALGMYFTELVVPFGAFGPRPLRWFAATAFSALMLFIGATGNYGFFNLLAIVLCLPLLDDGIVPRRWRETPVLALHRPAAAKAGWPWIITLPLAAAIMALTSVPLVRALHLDVALPPEVLEFYRLQAPFQVVNGYGLFAHMTTERPEIIVEGSDDGQKWIPYEFRWKPGDPQARPAFVQPHMPRLDWQMWFAALGSYHNSRWFLPFCLRLLQGSPPVVRLLKATPFADHPPRYLRATLYDYRFTNSAERHSTGAWWHRRVLRAYIPAVERTPEGQLRAAELE